MSYEKYSVIDNWRKIGRKIDRKFFYRKIGESERCSLSAKEFATTRTLGTNCRIVRFFGTISTEIFFCSKVFERECMGMQWVCTNADVREKQMAGRVKTIKGEKVRE